MTAATAGSPPRPNLDANDPGSAATTEPRDRGDRATSITVTTEGTTVVIAVEHTLDAPEGEALLEAARAALAARPDRLDIDLRAIDGYTEEGARALVACRDLSAELPEGLHYRTGKGPGRDALLAAYQEG
ncbi:MAG TPA: hypothetical protein VIL48_00120 [Acidimicrobiales bacterium]|jgi:RecA/RadA recombinase